jgi:TorA maturation chaperone TorD/DNA-binding transcriptional regulator YdaS (Cro superfamily)
MPSSGLNEAISAAGGISGLTRQLGISQPSVSNWTWVPADRVVAVVASTGVRRAVLRPDLYGEGTDAAVEPSAEIDEIEAARAQQYALLAALLVRAPDAAMLEKLSGLRGDASPLGIAYAALGEAASRTDVTKVEREYFNLFIGLGRGEILPYASYYLTGFLHERPLARLREDLNRLGIERSEGNYEPEDHAAILCEIMASLAGGRFPAAPGADREIFEKHMAPWIGRFFADVTRAESAEFYRCVGALGQAFIEIEIEAFALPS